MEAQEKRFDAFVDKAAAKEDFEELGKTKRMRSEEAAPDTTNDAGASSDSNNTGASSSSGSKEAQGKRGEKIVPESDDLASLDEAQQKMARRAAEAGLAIAQQRGEKRSDTTVTEREARAMIPDSSGQKRVDLDKDDSEMATNNTRVGQVHISTTAIRWCDVNDEMENDPLVNLENWKWEFRKTWNHLITMHLQLKVWRI